jgi:hypothetical protein
MLPPKLPRGETITYPRSVTPFSIVVGHGGVSWAEPRFIYHAWRGGREAVVAEFGREVRLFVCRNFPERRDRGAAVRAALRADFGYLAADLNTLPSVDRDFLHGFSTKRRGSGPAA